HEERRHARQSDGVSRETDSRRTRTHGPDRKIVVSSARKHRLYEYMKPATTSGFIAVRMENPALELEDFDRIVEQYRRRVLRFVFASVRDMDLAETLTQDCFWNAYKNRASFRGECSVNTWLMKIAVNLVRDQARNRRLQFWRDAQRVRSDEIHDWPDRCISLEERTAVSEQVRAVWET